MATVLKMAIATVKNKDAMAKCGVAQRPGSGLISRLRRFDSCHRNQAREGEVVEPLDCRSGESECESRLGRHFRSLFFDYSGVAQSAEQPPVKRKAAGSTPALGAI